MWLASPYYGPFLSLLSWETSCTWRHLQKWLRDEVPPSEGISALKKESFEKPTPTKTKNTPLTRLDRG